MMSFAGQFCSRLLRAACRGNRKITVRVMERRLNYRQMYEQNRQDYLNYML